MTIASTTVQTSGSTGNGATTQFSFSFSIADYGAVEAEDQIEVVRETISTGAEEVLVRGTDYSVSVNGDQVTSPGGSITMLTGAPSSAYKIWIRLNPSFLQATDYQDQGGFLMETVEDQADQHTRQILALKDIVRRAPHAGIQAGTSFDGEISGDLTSGYSPCIKSDLSGYYWGAPAGIGISAAWTPVVQTTIPAGQALIDQGNPFTDVASAATVDLGAVASDKVRITGSTGPITSFGTVAAGTRKLVRLASTPTITYNATSMILPGDASIVGQADDEFTAVSLGSGNWFVGNYQRGAYPPATVSSAWNALLAQSIPLAGRNLVLNGCARIWQDGTTITSTSTPANNDDTYICDQVILLSDGNDIVDVTQETTTKPTGAYASFCFDIETANKKFGILLPLTARDSASLISGNAVLSFEARKGGSNATAETLRAAIISWQGTADSITSDVVSAWGAAGADPTLAANWTYETTPQNLTLTTSFQKFDEDNGLAGAVDTASTKQCAVFIWLDDVDATVADLIYIGNIQLESGLVATPFEVRPFSYELDRAMFFYERSYDFGTALAASTSSGARIDNAHGSAQNSRWHVTFKQPKRTAPTMSIWGSTGTANAVRDLSGSADKTAAFAAIGRTGATANPTENLTDNNIHAFHWAADARL